MLEQIDCRLSATESKRDRTIFWLYYRQGFSAREIAELPGLGLTQKGVESCIHRLTNMLRAESGSPAFSVRKLEGKTAPKALGELE
jgi:RNA polymerase sigma-70 factor (ECF subfamily)